MKIDDVLITITDNLVVRYEETKTLINDNYDTSKIYVDGQVGELKEIVSNNESNINNISNDLSQYFEFNKEKGLYIKGFSETEKEAPVKSHYTNIGMDILVEEEVVAMFTNEGAKTKEITIGILNDNKRDWKIMSMADDHLSFFRRDN